jgi:DNA-binding transcriptional ArsR family regulator
VALSNVNIPVILYQLKLHEAERAILALVLTFKESGLIACNNELVTALNKSRSTITNSISRLEKAELIKVTKRQSKYRKIKFNGNLLTKQLASINPLLTKILASRTDLLTKLLDSTYQTVSNVSKEENDNIDTDTAFVLRTKDLWYLPQAKLDEYKHTYNHGLDVEYELRKAAQWLKDNPSKQKTATGMLKFLSGWLGRTKPAQTPQPSKLKDAVWNVNAENKYFDDFMAKNAKTSEELNELLEGASAK